MPNDRQNKLQDLRNQLRRLETEGVEEIRLKRIAADMGDDYRENEGAKLVMEEEAMLYNRMRQLREEILLLKLLALNQVGVRRKRKKDK